MPDPTVEAVEAATAAAKRTYEEAWNLRRPGDAMLAAIEAAAPILLAAGRREAAEALHLLPGSHVWALATGEPVGRREGDRG